MSQIASLYTDPSAPEATSGAASGATAVASSPASAASDSAAAYANDPLGLFDPWRDSAPAGPTCYQLPDGRIWLAEAGHFIAAAPAPANLVQLSGPRCAAIGAEAYLCETLLLHNFPLGEVAIYTAEGIRRKLAELDAQYLSPRTLAGLQTGDAQARANWTAHELAAEPLRQKLRQLEPAAPQA